jgi:hypothetical protein
MINVSIVRLLLVVFLSLPANLHSARKKESGRQTPFRMFARRLSVLCRIADIFHFYCLEFSTFSQQIQQSE